MLAKTDGTFIRMRYDDIPIWIRNLFSEGIKLNGREFQTPEFSIRCGKEYNVAEIIDDVDLTWFLVRFIGDNMTQTEWLHKRDLFK